MTQLFVLAGLLILATDPPPLPDGAVRRLGTPRFRHAAPVHHLAFSPDDAYLATVAPGECVRVWNPRTGDLVRELGPTPARGRNHVAFDGPRTLVALLADATLVRLDVPTGRRTLSVRLTDDANWRDYWIRPDGKRVQLADRGGAREFDAATGKRLSDVAGLPAAPFVEAKSHDGTLVAMGGPAGHVNVRPAKPGVPKPPDPRFGLQNLHLTDAGGTAVGWVLDQWRDGDREQRIVFGGWNVRTGAAVQFPDAGPRLASTSVASPDGRWTATGTPNGRLRVLDRHTGRQVVDDAGHPLAGVDQVWFAGPTRLVACLMFPPAQVSAIDWAGGPPVVTPLLKSGDRDDGLRLLHVTADGRRGVVQGRRFSPTVGVWDLTTGLLVRHMDPAPGGPALSPDGRRLAGFDVECRAAVWDVDSGRRRPGFGGGTRQWTGGVRGWAAFSPTGNLLATITARLTGIDRSPGEGVCQLWDADTGQAVATFRHPASMHGLAFTTDGRYLLTADTDGPVTVWDVYRPAAIDPGKAWADLASADGPTAYAAARALIASPATVKLVRDRLPPPAPPADVERWLTALDAPAFADREAASAALGRVARAMEPRLRKELAATASAEVRVRLEKLLAAIDTSPPAAGPADARDRRLVEVLTAIGTADARELLAGYAAGSADSRLAWEARAALGRLPNGGPR